MKRFKVIESTIPSLLGQVFNTETNIKKNVTLPFTELTYRCCMFDGNRVKLVNGEEYIIGILS